MVNTVQYDNMINIGQGDLRTTNQLTSHPHNMAEVVFIPKADAPIPCNKCKSKNRFNKRFIKQGQDSLIYIKRVELPKKVQLFWQHLLDGFLRQTRHSTGSRSASLRLLYWRCLIPLSFIVQVDASSVGVRAVLPQRSTDGKVHPCGFLSQHITPTETRYEVGDCRELLALKMALEEWRHWLEGAQRPFCGLDGPPNSGVPPAGQTLAVTLSPISGLSLGCNRVVDTEMLTSGPVSGIGLI